MHTAFNIADTRKFLKKKSKVQTKTRTDFFRKAQGDLQKIVAMIQNDYHPRKIVQWGSLLDESKFNFYSDIDLALDADLTAEEYFELIKKAENLTSFPLDILLFKDIHPKTFRDDLIKRQSY